MARLNADRTEQLARDERRQKRYSEAYVELLELVERMGHWSQLVRPMLDTDPPQELPAQLPSLAAQARATALASAYGSPEVNRLVTEYYQCVKEIIHCDHLLTLSKSARANDEDLGIKPNQVCGRPLNAKQVEIAKRDDLAKQISRELQ